MVRALPQPDGACTYPCGNCSQATRVAKTQYQHRFEFVPLGGEREAQKRTRSHIQSESSRKKAWRRLQKLNSTKVAPPSLEWIPRKSVAVTPRPVQRPDRPAPTKPARQPKITVKTRPSLPSIDPELLIDREYLRAAANDARSPSSIGSQSPTSSPERVFPLISQTSLGVGRIDPFDSLPRKGSWTTQRLLYHWATDYSRMQWTFVPKGEQEEFRQIILDSALSHPATFEVLLSKCAHHLAGLEGKDPARSKLAILHKMELVRQVMEGLQREKEQVSPEILLAMINMVDQEYRWGSPEVAKVHMSGFRNIVNTMGGPEGLPLNQLLGTNLLLVEGALPSNSASFLFDDGDLDQRCQDFISLFDDFDPVLLRMKLDPSYISGPVTWSDARRAIRPGSILHQLLSEPDDEPTNPSKEELRMRRVRENCRLESVFYILITLRIVRDAPADAALFLERLQTRITEWGFQSNDNVEMLSFALTKGQWRYGCLYGRPERAWKVTRLMSIAKRLSDTNRASVRAVLRRFLMPDNENTIDPDPFSEFNPARVRAEVLGT